MIGVRLELDADGVLASISVTGHASLDSGDARVSVVCAAVTGIVRACGQALDENPEVDVTGHAKEPGELYIRVGAVPATAREWLRGVTDVVVGGITRISRDAPKEVALTIVTRGDEHGS